REAATMEPGTFKMEPRTFRSGVTTWVITGYLSLLIAASAYGTRVHVRHWVRAAALRDAVEQSARDDPRMRACAEPMLDDLPDNFEGAYIFRTMAREAFTRDVGMTVAIGPSTGSCGFRWDQTRAKFVAADGRK